MKDSFQVELFPESPHFPGEPLYRERQQVRLGVFEPPAYPIVDDRISWQEGKTSILGTRCPDKATNGFLEFK